MIGRIQRILARKKEGQEGEGEVFPSRGTTLRKERGN